MFSSPFSLLLLLILFATLSLARPLLPPALHPRATDTGCDMTAGSRLMLCLGSYASVPPVAEATAAVGVQAGELCEQYAQIANCWGNGTYCREWLPLQIAADKLCALASTASTPLPAPARTASISSNASSFFPSISSSDSATSATSARTTTPPSPTLDAAAAEVTTLSSTISLSNDTFASVANEASQVVTSIWNNDSGTDIPSISNDIQPTKTEPTWTHPSSTVTMSATADVTAGVSTTRTGTETSGVVGRGRGSSALLSSVAFIVVAVLFL